jgi:hypothetical protein
MKLTTNKSQLAFIAEHPEMSRDYKEQEEEKKQDECQCQEPNFAFVTPSLRTDKTYFNFCNQCKKFIDVPAPQPRVLTF